MKTEYPYDKLYWQEFENVVIDICREILGIAAKKFSDGPDGGRDSKFEGTADKYPSSSAPWSGKFIIQAKHADSPIASCSDSDFFGNKSSSVEKEIIRLKRLKQEDPFENYLLFTNRKLSAGKHAEIKEKLRNELGIDNVCIIGKEEIDSYITDPIIDKFGLSKYLLPLRFFEKDIQDVIVIFHEQGESITGSSYLPSTDFRNVSKEEKNRLNNLSERYFKYIKDSSLSHFSKVEAFLKDPRNSEYANYYENTVSDLQGIIHTRRSEFAEFEQVIEKLVDKIVYSDFDRLKDIRRMVRVFIHFMYFNCDIGEKE